MGLPGRLRLEVDGGSRLRPAQTHERVRIKHSTVAVDDATNAGGQGIYGDREP